MTLEPFDAVEAKLFALLVSALLTNNVVIVSLVQQNLETLYLQLLDLWEDLAFPTESHPKFLFPTLTSTLLTE